MEKDLVFLKLIDINYKKIIPSIVRAMNLISTGRLKKVDYNNSFKLVLNNTFMQLIELSPKGKLIFVGDTHGDFEASKHVINNYLKPGNRIVFLGDYVDRGEYSKENIDFLLRQKEQHPEDVYLLQGNHEGKMLYDFWPSRFWDNLSSGDREKYRKIFEDFPLALSVGDIIALHGALPNIEKLEDFNKIKNGDENWNCTVWADFLETEKELLYHPRKAFLQDYFKKIMEKFNKSLLIRAHNPYTPTSIYGGRCVTLFTSSAYDRKKTIAIADFTKKEKITTIDDLIIEEI